MPFIAQEQARAVFEFHKIRFVAKTQRWGCSIMQAGAP